MTSTKSKSDAQTNAEKEILSSFFQEADLMALDKKSLPVKVELDGYGQDKDGNLYLIEVYARIGELKGAQPKKVCTDILKLIYCEKMLNKPVNKYILFVDQKPYEFFKNSSWYADAAKQYHIHFKVVSVSDQTKQDISAAQQRQKMVNAL